MKIFQLKKTALLAIISILLCLIVLATSTYAWFTSNSVVSTSKIESKTASVDVKLLLSSTQSPFNGSEEFTLSDMDGLMPVSTSDLETFCYNSGAEIGTNDKVYYHAEIYVKAEAASDMTSKLAIYLDNTSEDLVSADTGSLLLNGARFGFKFSNTENSSDTANADPIILRTSETNNASSAQADNTVLNGSKVATGKVLHRTSSGTTAVDDPSEALDDYSLENDDAKPLATLEINTIYKLDFYFYLEGTDPDCSSELAKDGCDFQLKFYGALTEE